MMPHWTGIENTASTTSTFRGRELIKLVTVQITDSTVLTAVTGPLSCMKADLSMLVLLVGEVDADLISRPLEMDRGSQEFES